MTFMAENKDGNVTVYDLGKLISARRAALSLARNTYGKVKADPLQDHIFMGKDGKAHLSVGIIRQDGWRQHIHIGL